MPFPFPVTITTNNRPRPLISACHLSASELAVVRSEFDYIDWNEVEAGNDDPLFFRYRGQWYDFGEFSRIIAPDAKSMHPMECAEPAFQGWDGYQADSYFSGTLIRLADMDDGQGVIVGRFSC